MDELISVIMPTYKRCKFLQRAIDSVLSQTYKNLELIVVDDNGTNSIEQNSVKSIIQIYKHDIRVKYIVNPTNVGGAISRNIGVLNSKGIYITFLDDDDVYFNNKIEIQYNKMKECELDISIVDDEVRNINGKLIKVNKRNLKEIPSKSELLVEHLMHHVTGTNDIMITKKFYELIGGFKDIESGQEYILMLNAILSNARFGYVSNILVTFYVHNEGRISTNLCKIAGQQKLIETKKKYFNYLSISQQKYVMCRHHVVCAYIYLKNHQFAGAVRELFDSFKISIICTLQIIKGD